MTRRTLAMLLGALAVASVLTVALVVVLSDDEVGKTGIASPSDRKGWQVLHFQGVKVEIPDAWRRVDRSGCEFAFEHWAPAGRSPCKGVVGVTFYGSATFDPAFGPGLRSQQQTRGLAETAWSGYVFAGEWAVYVATNDRKIADRVLSSARSLN